MLQVARLAPKQLAEATERVGAFLAGEVNDDGGGKDRAGASDLYYTVFVLDGLAALQQAMPNGATRDYLAGFGDGDGLDLVHLCCLARCRAAMGGGFADGEAQAIGDRIEAHRTADGSYAPDREQAHGTVYHAFLAFGARQDLGLAPVEPDRLVDAVTACRLPDGGFANTADVPMATTPTTAAGITLLRHLGAPADGKASDWLLARAVDAGGFRATTDAPMPDLLSTATALHALADRDADVAALRESTLDFVDSLWTGRAFCGNWADDIQDAEYTYYALLALGHLSVL